MQGTFRSAGRTVRLLHCDETVVVAETGELCVVIWRGAVTKEPFERQRAGLAEVVKRRPDGAGFICVVERTAKPPEGDELRRASSEMISVHGDRLKCVACVMEGEGFKTAINRGALAGMVLLLRNKKTAVSVFATVTEAAVWMGKHMGSRPKDEIVSVVDHIRSQLPLVRLDE